MAQPIIQTSFNSGEWAPTLNARVDVAKYHSGAALLENFFVDYRGGATASPGTKYVLHTAYPDKTSRLIPFQASLTVNYILEFSNGFIRFINNGAPVIEAAKAITGITNANPGVVTSVGHGYTSGNWVYITGVNGMTQVNGNYYIIANATANTFELKDLASNNVNTTSYGVYTSGGTTARIYTIASPYTSSELAQLKFAQNVTTMVLCHPNYPPYELKLITATNWTIAPIVFSSTMTTPTGLAVASTLGAGTVNYAYIVTAVDAGGQESGPSNYAVAANLLDMRSTAGTNTVTWTSITTASSYNVYKAEPRYGAAIPAGSMFGFIGNCTANTFIDSNIFPDFSSGPPVLQNPFNGSGVQTVTLTSGGSYGPGVVFPSISISGGGGSGATANALGGAISGTVNGVSQPLAYPGDILYMPNGVVLVVTAISPTNPPLGVVTAVGVVNSGSISTGTVTPGFQSPTGEHTQSGRSILSPTFKIALTWAVNSAGVISPGTGYATAPAVTFSSGAATAIATLGAASSGNPTVPGFFQQRLILAGPVSNPQQINMSQPGAYYNFNTTIPVAPDNAFQGSLVSGTLNTIQSLLPQPQGLVVLSDQSAWLINGGSAGSPISAVNVVANPQVFAGASYPPLIAAVDNILYIQAKNSIVRDLIFNFNKQVYTGSDISILSSHLFYGYSMLEWAWAEEPTKVVYVVRNDGIMLVLTFLKEQELVAWSHRTTQGSFKSVATITENSLVGKVNAVYIVVQRNVNGMTVQYIERFVEQAYPAGATDAWQVDAGLRYDGASTLSFIGAQHLATTTVTGLATDNLGNTTVITPFAMPVNGQFALPAPAAPATGYTRVTIGLSYTPKLKTLGINVGDPTIQGKMKKLPEVTLRVNNTLGLSIGTDFNNLVDIDDLVIGNVGKDTNELVTSLVTGDARQALDPAWTVPGQYCIQQNLPYPATILGLIPQLAVGDTKDTRS